MTEKGFLETKIWLLQERKRVINAEIDFKIKLLKESLALQKGFEVNGKYSLRDEIWGEDG